MAQLENTTAVITGGGTGIGRAIAQKFHDEGAFLILAGRRPEKLIESAKAISPQGERVLTVPADVTVIEDIEKLVAAAANRTGAIDILVNNAGAMQFDTLDAATESDWDLMMKTNAWGPWKLMAHVVPYMKKAGRGSIVNISSIAGIKAFPGAGLYCASKAALQVLSQVAAMENASENIRVNCILPAVVEDTELTASALGEENVQSFWDKFGPLHPLGRNGKPVDIADAALFLASPQSSWITGVLLNVDGGRNMATNRPAD
jgi:meso-butanediol dehydrogenase/(S,S)-butanediol dehydrogenase/diacetyl reductase